MHGRTSRRCTWTTRTAARVRAVLSWWRPCRGRSTYRRPQDRQSASGWTWSLPAPRDTESTWPTDRRRATGRSWGSWRRPEVNSRNLNTRRTPDSFFKICLVFFVIVRFFFNPIVFFFFCFFSSPNTYT